MTIAASKPVVAQSLCAHCAAPMGAGASGQFCCTGCEAVWATLHDCGLEHYYKLSETAGKSGNRPSAVSSHAYLDHEEFTARHVVVPTAGRHRVEMRLDGIKCGACLWLLEALPRLRSGLVSSRVDLGRSVITLEWVASETSLAAIADRVSSLGYEVRPIGTPASRANWRREDRTWLIDIAVAGAISANVMAIAFALYSAHLAWMDDATRQFLQWISVGLAAIAVFWPGRMFLRNACAAIRARRAHMDLPIALALLAGLLGGAVMTGLGREGVYFESVSMLVFLLLVGRFVQFRQQRRARHEVELLCALVPNSVRRIGSDGVIEEIPSDALRCGDEIEVPAGESVGADGVLLDACAHFDMQLLTGESRAVTKIAGEEVFAGIRHLDTTPVRVRVTAAPDKTRAASIVRMVESALAKRPPTVEFANRIAGWFLLAVVIIALGTGIAWWFIDPTRVLPTVIALLVVTCPCALGLATPLTMVASLGKAARSGILIRGGDVLERIAGVGSIVLDKTGTLTQGAMKVVTVIGDEDAIALGAALERHSAHPIARAIVEHAGTSAVAGRSATQVCEIQGRGITGIVDGQQIAVGSCTFARSRGEMQPGRFADESQELIDRGISPVCVCVDGHVAAILGIGDPMRDDAPALIGELIAQGWRVSMASGDVAEITTQVGVSLGIDRANIHGQCTPQDKAVVVGMQPVHPVLMIGDGVNDLPAMAASDVGIAVRQGAQATISHADVALQGGGLAQVLALTKGARRTMATIRVNFAISLAYNIVGGALAVTGLINPLIAAVLMPLSGLTVTAVALRMPRFDAPERKGNPR